jgi:hypothetical protein
VTTITNLQQQYAVDKTYEINVNEAPIMQVSPVNLSFTAVEGGANPPAQQVNIINKGGGVVNWLAVKDASWLSVSPSSGVAPAAMNVSIDITGLPAGNYVGYIDVDGRHPKSLCCADPCFETVRVSLLVIPPTPTPVSSHLRPPGMASLAPVLSAAQLTAEGPVLVPAASSYLQQNPEAVEFVIVLELKTGATE